MNKSKKEIHVILAVGKKPRGYFLRVDFGARCPERTKTGNDNPHRKFHFDKDGEAPFVRRVR